MMKDFWCSVCGDSIDRCNASQCPEGRRRSAKPNFRGGIVTHVNYYTMVNFSNPADFYPVTKETIMIEPKGETE